PPRERGRRAAVKDAAADAVLGAGLPLTSRVPSTAAWTVGLFVATMIAVAIPVLTHPLPPLSDYINHLATAHVVDAIAADPDLGRFYRIEWEPIPNLMMDLVVPLVHRFMSIYVAGQIFTLSIFATILSGMLVLHRALNGRWSAVPLLASPFLYSGVLLVGVM